VIKKAYTIGADLALHDLISGDAESPLAPPVEGLSKEASAAAVGHLSRFLGAAKGLFNASKASLGKGWGSFTSSNIGAGTATTGRFLLGMPKAGAGRMSRFGHHWIGMPTGFGLLNVAMAPEEAHKGKAFLKGFAGGLAFNAAMPLGSALGKGLFTGVRRANPNAFHKSVSGSGARVYTTPFKELGLKDKMSRGTYAAGGLLGGLGLGIAASGATESVADKALTQAGLSDRVNIFNPVRY